MIHIVLELIDNRKIILDGNSKSVTLAYSDKNLNPIKLEYKQLKTGKLLFDPTILCNGFIFLDNDNNVYDTIKKKIFFINGEIFVGDSDKQAFSLFDNFDIIENNIKQTVEKLKKIPDDNNNNKNEIKNNMCNEIMKELNNFNLKNIIFKNGKYCYPNGKYYYIHENICEYFENNNKIFSGDFFQEIKDNQFFFQLYGNMTNYKNNYEGENFYGVYFGRYGVKNNEKFRIPGKNIQNYLQEIGKTDKSIIYKIIDERITLEQMYDINIPVRIIVKEKNNKNIIYEINVKMSQQKELYGNALIKDYRTGEILIANINTNNIISNDILKDFPLFQDKNEYEAYKDNRRPKKENIIKNDVLKVDKIINDENVIENIAEGINEEITKEKIKHFGVTNQMYSGECWVYSLSLLICLTNARKYGRKLENIDEIYNNITNNYYKYGKTDREMDIIMKEILNKYGLKHEKIENEARLKEYIKKGFKCLATFHLNKLEWNNFNNFSQNFKQGMVLTKDILEQQNFNINPNQANQVSGHSVILSHIDESDNYTLINSWGKNWGNNGTFQTRKECLKDGSFFVIYYDYNQLTKEEYESWAKLKNDIKINLKNIKDIRCPKCNRSDAIEKFEILESLKCPYEQKCLFVINNQFFVQQLLSYDFSANKDAKMKFNYGFG